MIEKKVLRIIDANLNRVREGLRVCEEVVRFVQDDKKGSAAFKRIRHDVNEASAKMRIKYGQLVASRDSANDVGNDQVILGLKSTAEDVFIRNIKRAQEAVRVLEEFSKLQGKSASQAFQKIRFDLYTLEKKIVIRVFGA